MTLDPRCADLARREWRQGGDCDSFCRILVILNNSSSDNSIGSSWHESFGPWSACEGRTAVLSFNRSDTEVQRWGIS